MSSSSSLGAVVEYERPSDYVSQDGGDFYKLNAEHAHERLENGDSGTYTIDGHGVRSAGSKFVSHVVMQAYSFGAGVNLAAYAAGYSPVARIRENPRECAFNAIKAITCKDGENLAKRTLDNWISGERGSTLRNDFGGFAKEIQERNSYVDEKGVAHGFETRDVNSFKLTGMEYALMYTLADKDCSTDFKANLLFGCTRMLANEFQYSKEPAEMLKEIKENAKMLLEASSGADYDTQKGIVGSYILNLQKSKNIDVSNFCRSKEFLKEFGSVDAFVQVEGEGNIHDDFVKNDRNAAVALFSAMRDGSFPGMSASGAVDVTLPSIYLSSVSGDKAVTPRGDMYMTLLMNTKDRLGKDFGRIGSVGYAQADDVTKNLWRHDKDGFLRPASPVGCYYAAERRDHKGKKEWALCKTEFIPLDVVEGDYFREKLENTRAKEEVKRAFAEKKGMAIDASGCKTIQEYLGKLKAASDLGVPFRADKETVIKVRLFAEQVVGKIARNGKYMPAAELKKFWGEVDSYAVAAKEPYFGKAKEIGMAKEQNRGLSDGMGY